MSDERWQAHFEGVKRSYSSSIQLVKELRPDIFYRASNSAVRAFPKTHDNRPTPEQIRAQIEAQRGECQEFVAAGIPCIGSYICAVSSRGNPERRLGMWDFYDHWSEYREVFQLGAKPATDPSDWLQRRFGSGQPYVRAWDKRDRYGNIGYMNCPNNSGWRAWQCGSARTYASIGYRNMFVDNPSMYCECSICRNKFKGFLRRRVGERWEDLFGDLEIDSLDMRDPSLNMLRWEFWAESTADELSELKAAMAEVVAPDSIWQAANGVQLGCPPGYSARPNLGSFARGGVNIAFKESPYEFCGVNLRDVGGGLIAVEPGDIYDAYRFVRGTRQADCYGAPSHSYANLSRSETLHQLAFSEALALDGVFIDGAGLTNVHPDTRPKCYAYVRENRELFRTGESLAEVVVVISNAEFFAEPDFYGDAARDVHVIRDWLSDQQILFDYALAETLPRLGLSKYRIAIVPGFRTLSDDPAECLVDFARRGGVVIVSGPVGTHHTEGPRRPAPLFASESVFRNPAAGGFRLYDGLPRPSKASNRRPWKAIVHNGTRFEPEDEENQGFTVRTVGRGKLILARRRFVDADKPNAFSMTWYRPHRPQTLGGKTRSHGERVALRTNRDKFLAALDAAGLGDLSAVRDADMPGLRVAARYRVEGERPWLAFHLVNEQFEQRFDDSSHGYDLQESGQPCQRSEIDVVLPLPAGWRATSASWACVPESAPEPLAFESIPGCVRFQVPKLDYYSVVIFALARSGTEEVDRPLVGGLRQVAHADQGVYRVGAADLALGHEQPKNNLPLPWPERAGVRGNRSGRPLRLIFTHPAFFFAKKEEHVTVRFQIHAPEEKWGWFWVVDPHGRIVSTKAAQGGKTVECRFRTKIEGTHLVQGDAGAHEFSVECADRALVYPATVAQRLGFVDQPPEFLFIPPRGVTSLAVSLQTRDKRAAYRIVDPEGREIVHRDGLGQAKVMDEGGALVWTEKAVGARYQRVEFAVPEKLAGKPWRLRFQSPRPSPVLESNFYFDQTVYVTPAVTP